jgi:hypothetical protein
VKKSGVFLGVDALLRLAAQEALLDQILKEVRHLEEVALGVVGQVVIQVR